MSSANMTADARPRPVDPRRRIEAIDMVRGFALFGVLLVNMYNFGSFEFYWTEPIDQVAWSIKRFFFETKSWRLFSFLFGLGFALQLLRAKEKCTTFRALYLRRLIILFIIGAGHGLIYDGDILMLYAELGLVLVLFRRVNTKLLLILSLCLLAVFPIGRATTTLLDPPQETTASVFSNRIEDPEAWMEELRRTDVYAVGSVWEVMAENAYIENPFSRPLGPESSLARFAMFLLGLYVGRRRIFHDIQKNMRLIRNVFWWGLTVGIACMGAERLLHATTGYEVFRGNTATLLPTLLGDVLFVYGSTVLALAYAAGITILAQHSRGKRILSPLGSAGRMALTVYLSGSIMFSVLFYGFAFGQVFRLGPAAVSGYAVLFFALQMVFCVWWTKRLRFGPMEWLWRGLTYLKFPAMNLQKGSSSTG